MTICRRLLLEPLVQFLVIGVVVFLAWSWFDRSPREADRRVIDVSSGRVAQLYETFTRAWQRPPTPQEFNGLIDAFVKEEIFYREGTKMGLDRDDTIFRRRMQQKMEFLMEPGEAELNATEAELQAYLKENAGEFRIPVRVAFRQIFLDRGKHGQSFDQDLVDLLASLQAGEGSETPPDLGDPSLLPAKVPLTRLDQIAGAFGGEYAEALAAAPSGRWAGPLISSFGHHLVFVEERTDAREPALGEVRDAVLREWQAAKRRTIAEERYRALRANYDVTVALPGEKGTFIVGASSD